jgi:hypothetical protein
LFLDVIIVCIIGAVIIFAVANYFYRPPIEEPYYLEVTGTSWNLDITFTSNDVFGARTPLFVQVTAWSDNRTTVDPVYVYFPDSTHNPPRYSEYDELYTPSIEAYQSEADFKFRGNETIVYRSEGMKYVIFSDHPVDRIPSEFLRPNVTGHFDLIHISSENSKLGYETNKATVFLGIVAVALAVASVRDILRRFFT